MKENLNVTFVQAALFSKDIRKNLTYFEKVLEQSKRTDIIILPEMFNSSFCPESINMAESMTGNTITWMRKISTKHNCAVSGSLMVRENKKIFNRLVWIFKDNIITYDKCHLFSLANEDKFLSKGKKRTIIKYKGWKICPVICYDLRFPVFCRNDVNYDMLIIVANWPKSRVEDWKVLLQARAIENQAYVVGVNRVGKDENNIIFSGESKVYNSFGEKVLDAKDKEGIFNVNLSQADLVLKRRQRRFLKDKDKFTIS